MDKIIVDDKTYKVVERKSERFQELLETAMDALQEATGNISYLNDEFNHLNREVVSSLKDIVSRLEEIKEEKIYKPVLA
jgi:hypothetical protein